MNFKETVIAVGLARKQAFKLPFFGQDDQPGDHLLGLGDDLLVTFHLPQLDQAGGVVQFRLKRGDYVDLAFKPVLLAHRVLGGGLIVPEITVRAQRLKLGKTRRGGVEIDMLSKQVDGRGDDVDPGLRFSLHVLSVPGVSGAVRR